MVSLTVFNGGFQSRYTGWRSFAVALDPLARLHAIAPHKPIELSEVGCAEQGGNKAAWIAGMFSTLRRYPAITSVIWYDLVKGSDWRVESSVRATARIRRRCRRPALPLTPATLPTRPAALAFAARACSGYLE